MPSDPVLEFEALLPPISDDRPAGVFLKNDPADSGIYYDIKDLRDEARKEEERTPSGDDGIDEAPPNPIEKWKRVRNKCISVLESKTKDIEFAAYLTEAMMRVDQAAGLRDGFRLMREFVERFWDGLNPPPDPEASDPAEEMEPRLTPVNNLNNLNFTLALHGLSLDDREQVQDPPTFFDYLAAHTAAYPKSGKGASFEKMQELKKRVAGSSEGYVRRVYDDLIAAKEELLQLRNAFGAVVGEKKAPSVNLIREKIDDLLRYLKDVAPPGSFETTNGEASGGEMVPGTPGVVGGTVNFVAGPTVSREDALRTLLEIAAFFRKSEPHSPVSYHVEEAVRWGRMSLAELLKELIPNGDARGTVLQRIGIQEESQPPPPE